MLASPPRFDGYGHTVTDFRFFSRLDGCRREFVGRAGHRQSSQFGRCRGTGRCRVDEGTRRPVHGQPVAVLEHRVPVVQVDLTVFDGYDLDGEYGFDQHGGAHAGDRPLQSGQGRGSCTELRTNPSPYACWSPCSGLRFRRGGISEDIHLLAGDRWHFRRGRARRWGVLLRYCAAECRSGAAGRAAVKRADIV